MSLTITPLKKYHISAVVDVHMRAFPNFFLTFLGPSFLSTFYSFFLYESTAIALVAEDDNTGRVFGSVVGTLDPEHFFTRLLKMKWWSFCLASMRAFYCDPKVTRRLWRALFYRGDIPPGPKRALLSSISVCPEARGLGIGRALMDRWINAAKILGASGCYLTTDAVGNDEGNRFYQRAGWVQDSTFVTPAGRKMHRYMLDFLADVDSSDE